MAALIQVDIVTPEKIVFTDRVRMVIARTGGGEIGVLPGHAPLMACLKIAPLRLLGETGEREIAASGGFIEVRPEKVTVLTDSAEFPEDIDVKRALEAKERAEKRLHDHSPDIDEARAQAALQRALVRLKVKNAKK